MGSPINKDSHNIMDLIEPDTVGCEIGVWMGSSSERFLKRRLRKFHMVDAWSVEAYKESTEHGTYENYLERYSKICGGNTEKDFQRHYDNVYKDVCNKFKQYAAVRIHRMHSDEWFENYDGEKLDWIYVDGDHSYEGCLKDLNNAKEVVKPGGLILGDDYGWPDAKWQKKGVTKAVNEFINKNNITNMIRHGMTQYEIRL